ncbi:MAG: hypothetical protein LBR84_10095 [Tannerella sp.]|jgi:hypothetical protein|nr:hypothetical protein [Tannerella sp.]
MNKKIFFYALAMLASMATSCNKDDDEQEILTVPDEYIYVLNNGNWGSNDASLTMLNLKDSAVTQEVFYKQNGRHLGDLGQDIIIHGSKMYITVNGSSTIEVTDLDAKSIKQIKTEGMPHSLAAFGEKVYATYMNGIVVRIDTASLEIDGTVAVGRNPEQMTVVDGKLYVANTGGQDYNTETGYDKTVSVVDIATFRELTKITVHLNPRTIISDNSGNVYVVSYGNYMDIPNKLQKIDTKTHTVTDLSAIVNGTYIATVGDILYSIDAPWGGTAKYYSYNGASNSLISDNFIGNTAISSPFSLSTDEESGEIYISTSDYVNNGDLYVFDKSGNPTLTFETGLNPMKAVRIKKQ